MNETPSPTVGLFSVILSGALTQYDARESRRHPNLYRLGHLFAAANRAEAGLSKEDSSHEGLAAFARGIEREFIVRDMTPARNTVKAIQAWIAEGKRPKYPTSKAPVSDCASA